MGWGQAWPGMVGQGKARKSQTTGETMTTKLYPDYKQAAEEISTGENVFYSDNDLSDMLNEAVGTDQFRFAIMKLNSYLLDAYMIDFIRSENEAQGKGYKIATDEERIEITAKRLSRKVWSTTGKQRKVLDTVDRAVLPDVIKGAYDRHMIRSGLLISFLNKTPLSKCLPGAMVRVDVPKMIEL